MVTSRLTAVLCAIVAFAACGAEPADSPRSGATTLTLTDDDAPGLQDVYGAGIEVMDDGTVWVAGGVHQERSPDWTGLRTAALVDATGAIKRTVSLPIAEGVHLRDTVVDAVNDAVVVAGLTCGDIPGENAGCDPDREHDLIMLRIGEAERATYIDTSAVSGLGPFTRQTTLRAIEGTNGLGMWALSTGESLDPESMVPVAGQLTLLRLNDTANSVEVVGSLPTELTSERLCVSDGYLYGVSYRPSEPGSGMEIGLVTLLRAPLSDPLKWETLGSVELAPSSGAAVASPICAGMDVYLASGPLEPKLFTAVTEGAVVDKPTAIGLEGGVTNVQRTGESSVLTAVSDTTTTVWRLDQDHHWRSIGSAPRPTLYPPMVVELDGYLVDVGPLAAYRPEIGGALIEPFEADT